MAFDDAAPTFVWGANGARMTPDQIAAQRKVADALAAQGMDASPFPAGTRGAGLLTQGLARLAKGVAAGFDYREADAAAKQNADDNKSMIAALLGGGTAPAAAASSAPASTPAAASAARASLDPETTGYINAAAAKYGVDPAYLSRTAMIESGGKADAVNPTSGAKGLYQFMPATAKEYELDNPLDPEDSAMAAAELTKDNRDALTAALGRPPTNAELYLAHQQGAAGAARLLTNPNANAASLVGHAAVLNNGGADSMTGAQFAHMWLSKYGPDGQVPQSAPAPVQVASNDSSFMPLAAASAPPAAVAKVAAALSPVTVAGAQYPSPLNGGNTGTAVPLQNASLAGFPDAAPMAPQAPAPVPAAPAVAKVAAAMPGGDVAPIKSGLGNVNPAVLQAITSPYADDTTKKIAGLVLQQQMTPKEIHAQVTDSDGNVYDVNRLTGERKVILKADTDPTSVREYNFYKSQLPPGQQPMPYDQWSTAKARAGAVNVTQNVDTNASQTYDKQLAEGLSKSHAALANGVEEAQARARSYAQMQGAIDAIQRGGGTTGGLAPEQRLTLMKSANAAATALGLEPPFDENAISDKEMLAKSGRQLAGEMAKNAVGSRVTNFEMQNYLNANPGLALSATGNQRLIGIGSQIEQRNIAVGNAIRNATATAISQGKKIDPVTVQRIITDYDNAHHIQDPITGQDLTQSYVLPEFQAGGTNATLAGQHETNVSKIQRTRSGVGWSVQ